MSKSVVTNGPFGFLEKPKKNEKMTESFLVNEMCNVLLAIRKSSIYNFVKEESKFKFLDFEIKDLKKKQITTFTDIGQQSFQIFDFLGMIRSKTLTFAEFCACLDDIYVEMYEKVIEILSEHQKKPLSLLQLEIRSKDIRNQVDFIHSIVKNLSNLMNPPLPPKSEVTARFLTDLFNLTCEYQVLTESYSVEFSTIFRLFHRSLRPYIRFLDGWCFEGRLVDPFNEFMIYENAATTENSERYWDGKYYIRPEDSTPEFLKRYENVVLSTGKSTRLIQDIETEKLFESLVDFVANTKRDKLEDMFIESICRRKAPNVFRANDGGSGSTSESPAAVTGEEKEIVPIGSVLYSSPKYSQLRNEESSSSSALMTSGRKLKLISTTLGLKDHIGKEKTVVDEEKELDEFIERIRIHSPFLEREDEHEKEEVNKFPSANIPFKMNFEKSLPDVILQQYKHVSSYLSKLILFEQCKLFEHLLILKVVFLMERGDIMDYFSSNLFLNESMRLVDVNVLLKESLEYGVEHPAVYNIFGQEYTIFNPEVTKRFNVLYEEERDSHVIDLDFINKLKFNYDVEWPLNILVDSTVLDMLNKVKSFLLVVKRAHHAVCNVDLPKRWVGAIFHKINMVLHQFKFFIGNLQNYLLTKTHHDLWPKLMLDLKQAKDFDAIKKKIAENISSIFELFFFKENFVQRGVNKILGLALKMQAKANTFIKNYVSIDVQTLEGFSKRDGLVDKMNIELDTIAITFKSNMNSLLTVLKGFLSRGRHQELEDLLMKLTFNKFYGTV